MKTLKLLLMLFFLLVDSIHGFSQKILVTTGRDSIAGSLREAINKAESGDTVVFEKSLTEILLGKSINIYKSLTIKGNPGTVIRGRGADLISPRVFEITGESTITVNFESCNLFKTGFYIGDTVSYNTDGGVIWIKNANSKVNINSCYFKTVGSFGGYTHYYPQIQHGQNGGAIANYGGILSISNSTFSGLSSGGYVYTGAGGAIFQLSGKLMLKNCTFFGNSVWKTFSSTRPYIGHGSAIYSQNSQMDVLNCTFCEHTNHFYYFRPAPNYGEVSVNTSTIFLNNSSLGIKNSIFYNNDKRDVTGNAGSTLSSGGYNIFDQTISQSEGASSSDIFNVNPGFQISGNGSVTLDKSFWIPFCALDAAGLAIDALPSDGNGGPEFDQRGHARINTPDIGAIESESCIPTDMRAMWNPSEFGQVSMANEISVVNDSVVWVRDAGADSISITNDGGNSWKSKPLPFPSGITNAAGGICAVSSSKAYFILSLSDSKGIYMTTDTGNTWTRQASAFNQSNSFPNFIHFWNENQGIALGDATPNFEIYTTTNGGTQWNRVAEINMPAGKSESTYNTQEAYRVNGSSFSFLTNKARIFRSMDYGKNWKVINTPFHNAVDSLITFDFKDNLNGLISYCSNDGLQHKMYKTINGGQTWDSISTTNYFQRIKYIPSVNAYCSMNINGGLSYSCNDGQTWTTVSYFRFSKLRSASYSPSGKIYLGGLGNLYSSTPLLSVVENKITIAAPANSTKTFEILSNTNWKVASNQNWLTVSSFSGSGNATILLSATANPTTTIRTTSVRVSGHGFSDQIITVTQDEAAKILTVSTDVLTIKASASSSMTFDITSNMDWKAESNQSWLTFSKTSGFGNSTVALTATVNSATTSRTAIVNVSGTGVANQTITVMQEPGATGINEINKPSVSIFPNPAYNELTVSQLSMNCKISIADLNGKVFVNRIAKSTIEKFNLRSLANGVYTITVTDKKTVKRSKLIKQ